MINKNARRILLAEDEPNLQFLVISQLTTLGYKAPDIADNGLVAIEMAAKTKYDLVLMDVVMPDMDGLAAAERIRREESVTGAHTVMVGMTAFSFRERCLDAGMDDFLQKPVLLEQMDAMLSKWLTSDSSGQPSEPATCSSNPAAE